MGIDDAAVIDQIQRDRDMQPSRTNFFFFFFFINFFIYLQHKHYLQNVT